MYYEIHITLGLSPVSAQPLIEALNGWSFSAITGDPILGKDAYEYATRHASGNTPFDVVKAQMSKTAAILKDQGFDVVRQKIELVLLDTKGV